MILRRKESWGRILYDTKRHNFEVKISNPINELPYVSYPLLLNVDLTFKCNLECRHCVAKDMAKLLGGVEKADFFVSDETLNLIRKSPFIVIVITGGEPLLGEYQGTLVKMIKGLDNKGIVIDTNGTVFPTPELLTTLKQYNVMVRVSWDIPHPEEEANLRKYPRSMYSDPSHYLSEKEKFIKFLIGNGIQVAIQSVINRRIKGNRNLYRFPHKIKDLGITKWYIQRFIPSHELKTDKNYIIELDDYERAVKRIRKICKQKNLSCFTKKDRRHNGVFLLVGDCELYTQSDDRPGEKVFLGKLDKIENYFEYVSSSEHSNRYYEINEVDSSRKPFG